MHQLGHGVILDIIVEFHKFLTSTNNGVKFESLINEIILDVIFLDWCKLKTYPKKQWVSENTFGFSRLIQYFTAMLIANTDLHQRHIDAPDALLLFEKAGNCLSIYDVSVDVEK